MERSDKRQPKPISFLRADLHSLSHQSGAGLAPCFAREQGFFLPRSAKGFWV